MSWTQEAAGMGKAVHGLQDPVGAPSSELIALQAEDEGEQQHIPHHPLFLSL